jgi:hypothetical protein
MNDDYLPGAMVMGWSLRNNGAVNRKIVAFVTIDNVSASTITELKVCPLQLESSYHGGYS